MHIAHAQTPAHRIYQSSLTKSLISCILAVELRTSFPSLFRPAVSHKSWTHRCVIDEIIKSNEIRFCENWNLMDEMRCRSFQNHLYFINWSAETDFLRNKPEIASRLNFKEAGAWVFPSGQVKPLTRTAQYCVPARADERRCALCPKTKSTFCPSVTWRRFFDTLYFRLLIWLHPDRAFKHVPPPKCWHRTRKVSLLYCMDTFTLHNMAFANHWPYRYRKFKRNYIRF